MADAMPERVLVTGAAGDIGRAIAVSLAGDGVAVVVADLPQASDALDDTLTACRAAGDSALTKVMFDVGDVDQVHAAFTEIAASGGPVDGLCNNAGRQGEFTNVLDVSPADAESVLRVNLLGATFVLQAFAQRLVGAGAPGAVVNTASMAGVSGAPNMAAYSASKAGLIGLTKSAAKDLAPHDIRVNAVSPGFIGPGAMWDNQVAQQAAAGSQYFADNPATVSSQMISQIPLRRYGSIDEVVSVVRFLLSPASSYLTGTNVEISGGAA